MLSQKARGGQKGTGFEAVNHSLAALADGPVEFQPAEEGLVADGPLVDGFLADGPVEVDISQDGLTADGLRCEVDRCYHCSLRLTACCELLRYLSVVWPRRLYSFGELPDHLILRIFRDTEYVPKGISEQQAETGGSLYEQVTDDTLTVLIDGYQKRCGLPQVCKRWSKLLSQPSFVWAYLNIGFHELWNVQQVRFAFSQALLYVLVVLLFMS